MEMNERRIKPDLDEFGYPNCPMMNFFPNEYGQMCLALWGWDTQESVDGYTLEEIDDLIQSLEDAKKHLINISDGSQGTLFDEGDNDD